MAERQGANRKLSNALELLRAALAEANVESGDPQSHWDIPVLPPPDPEGRLSSTDLLAWWFRAPKTEGQDRRAWDAYFGEEVTEQVAGKTAAATPSPALSPGRRPPRRPDADVALPAGDGWRPPWSVFPELQERLAEEHAQAAVDTLYDFVHAFGRGEVDAAMALVDEDYHVMEDDAEVDRLRLRQSLETLVDELRGWQLEVSLAEAPEPVSHPLGILIPALIQVEALHPAGERRCWVDRRVALLRQSPQGEWKISALCPLTP